MDRSRAGWALALLLGASGCAGGGGRRMATATPGVGPVVAPARSGSGGLFARRAVAPRPLANTNPAVARYFPGLPHSEGPAPPDASSQPSGPPASRMLADAFPMRRGRPPGPSAAEAAPLLPTALHVAVHPADPDPPEPDARRVSLDRIAPAPPVASAAPPPLVEARRAPAPPPVVAAPRARPRPTGDEFWRTASLPAALPPVLFPKSYYAADPRVPTPGPAPSPPAPPPARRAWRRWDQWPGLSRREPGDVPKGG